MNKICNGVNVHRVLLAGKKDIYNSYFIQISFPQKCITAFLSKGVLGRKDPVRSERAWIDSTCSGFQTLCQQDKAIDQLSLNKPCTVLCERLPPPQHSYIFLILTFPALEMYAISLEFTMLFFKIQDDTAQQPMFSGSKDDGNDHNESNIVTIMIIINIIDTPLYFCIFFQYARSL